jgi:hypothetical protein
VFARAVLLLMSPAMGAVAPVAAQPVAELRFGVVVEDGRTTQARFETTLEQGRFVTIVYAPYGVTPTPFTGIEHSGDRLEFTWLRQALHYRCSLRQDTPAVFQGGCVSSGRDPVSVTMRPFTPEDAALQGNSLTVTTQELAILARARALMMDGRSWNRRDNRVCDGSGYPYRWSLFCALHQASIEVDSDYRHLRPAVRAVRQAIERRSPERNYAHMLQDFNNEAQGFAAIVDVLAAAEADLARQLR